MGKRTQDRVKKIQKKEAEKSSGTTSLWQKLEKIQIRSKKECIESFVKLLKDVESGKYKFEEGVTDMGKYFVVNETGRQKSNFVHVVPKEAYEIFEEMRRSMPDSFLGFSVLCGKINGRDARVSCFAVPTSEITRSMISKRR